MKQYQINSLLDQISSHTARLALPFSDIDCLPLEYRKALHSDIVRAIDDLYDRSFIDSFAYAELSARARSAYIHGGL